MCGTMPVVRYGLNVAVDVRIEVLPSLALIDSAGDYVPEMGDDAGADQHLSLGVVVDSPRIAEAVSDHLEDVFRRVVTPDAAVDVDALAREQIVRKRIAVLEQAPFVARLPDLRRRGISLESV